MDEEKIKKIEELLFKEYSTIDEKTINQVIEVGHDLTIDDMIMYVNAVQDEKLTIPPKYEKISNDNYLLVFPMLFSNQEIVKKFMAYGMGNSIPEFIKAREDLGLEKRDTIDFNPIVVELLKKNDTYACKDILNYAYSQINKDTKKTILEYIKNNQYNLDGIAYENPSIVIDLMKLAQDLNYDYDIFKKIIMFDSKKNILQTIFYEEEFELLKKYSSIASEKDQNLISQMMDLMNVDVINDELYLSNIEKCVVHNLESISYNSAARKIISSISYKKGYRPSINIFEKACLDFGPVLDKMCIENLSYLLIYSSQYYSYGMYFDDPYVKEIYEKIDSPKKRMILNLFKKCQIYRANIDFFSNLNEMLDEKNIDKYFDEKGCKKEFLFEISPYILKNNETFDGFKSNFINVMLSSCYDQLDESEKRYYTTLGLILEYEGNHAALDCFASQIKNPEDMNNLLKDKDSFIKFLKNNNNFTLVSALIKIGAIDDEIKTTLYNKQQIATLNMVEELFKINYDNGEILNICKEVYQTKDMFTVDGKTSDKLINYLIDQNKTDIISKLSTNFFTEEQQTFINLTNPIIAREICEENSKYIEFIKTVINDKEELKKYVQNGKPTSLFMDKMFEEGLLYTVIEINEYESLLSEKQKLIMNVYNQIDEEELKKIYSDFIKDSLTSIYQGEIKEELIELIPGLLKKIKLSNSSDIAGRYQSIAKLILQNAGENSFDPTQKFMEIEKIFLTKELSHMDKIFKSFQLLYPHEKLLKTITQNKNNVSPTLYKYATAGEETILGQEAKRIYGDSTYAVEMIMYSDLLKITIASNNRSFSEYIDTIEKGNELFTSLINREKSVEALTGKEKMLLSSFTHHLEYLYNENHQEKIHLSNELTTDLENLMKLYQNTDMKMVPDSIIESRYKAYLGISTMQELKKLMENSKVQADSKGRENAERTFDLVQGDILKGIGQIKYLDSIIQNGSVSKEFLGGDVGSDLTPFDTDLSFIKKIGTNIEGTVSKQIEAVGDYGPIYFVLKNGDINKDEKFNITRSSEDQPFELVEDKETFGKMELFRTLADSHYGIRTGFPSTQIDYIYIDGNSDVLKKQIGLVLAMNGFYVPVVNNVGDLVFTPDEYDKLREKMGGLSHYGITEYNFSDNLSNSYTNYFSDLISGNIQETKQKKERLQEKLREGFNNAGLEMKLEIDGDMQTGSVELIDTGSTGRGTNQIGDGDFDYTVRLDRIDMYSSNKKTAIEKSVCEGLNIPVTQGNVRKAKVDIGGEEVEIDISYAPKSDSISYTTDMCLTDRLETIKDQDPQRHLQVLANIVLAKNILKSAECYKPHHASENPQGGLGGVGVENWILQNGGSLEDAAIDFLTSTGVLKLERDEIGKITGLVIDENLQKTYDDFKTNYNIWDFGQNQLTEERNRDFPHDDFVWNNMNQRGYGRMVKAMQTYMLELHPEIKFIPKAEPVKESENEKNEREKLATIETKVKGLLQSINPKIDDDMSYSIDESTPKSK